MAISVKISQLVEGGSITSSDYIPISRGSIDTFKIAASQIVTTGQNIGGAPGTIFKTGVDGNGRTLQFRSLSGVDGISVVTAGDTLVVSASGQAPIKTSITGNGIRTSWPLTPPVPINPNNHRVDIDGVLQEPAANYSIAGSNIIFATPPPNGSKVTVISDNYFFSQVDVIPSDGSVTENKIVPGAVTNSKITGPISINNGGTGATSALGARNALGLPLSVHFVPVNFSTRSNISVPIIPGTGNNILNFDGPSNPSNNYVRVYTGTASANPWWSGINTVTLPNVPQNAVAALVHIYFNVNSTRNNSQFLFVRRDNTENWGNPTLTSTTPGDITTVQRDAFTGDYLKIYLDPTGNDNLSNPFEAESDITIPIYFNTTTNTFQWFIMDRKETSTAGLGVPESRVRMTLLGYYIQVL